MAISPININPLDLSTDKAVGINLPLNDEGVFKANYQTKDAIKYNLINFFLTDPGERPLNPTFGGGIRAFIFEQLTNNNLDFLKEDIQVKVSRNFPQISIQSLDIFEEGENQIRVALNYIISNTNIRDEINLFL